jgi:hypothetical protein
VTLSRVPGTALSGSEHVLILIARETVAGDDGVEAGNMREVFTDFDWCRSVCRLVREGALTIGNARIGQHVDWRDGGIGAELLLTQDDSRVRLDAGIDDMKEGYA